MSATARDRELVLRAYGATKQAADLPCPGSRIRSRGMGRGLGRGMGRGPIGIPVGEKMQAIFGVKGPAEPKAEEKKKEPDSKKKTKKQDKEDTKQAAVQVVDKAVEAETKPGVVKLESASDTPAKPAKKKKPEAVSENAIEEKKAATLADATPQRLPGPFKETSPATSGDIPVLGSVGGATLGGLEALAKGIGWEGAQNRLRAWGQSPQARNIAGGTTATLAAIATALAARQMLKGRGEEDEDMYAEAAAKLDHVKQALLGSRAKPLEASSVADKYNLPVRNGVSGFSRSRIFANLDSWSKGK